MDIGLITFHLLIDHMSIDCWHACGVAITFQVEHSIFVGYFVTGKIFSLVLFFHLSDVFSHCQFSILSL